MSNTTKNSSNKDANQALGEAFNDVDDSLSINGFLVAKIGRKVTMDLSDGDTVETYTFKEGSTTLYVLTLTYTDSNRTVLVSAERTA